MKKLLLSVGLLLLSATAALASNCVPFTYTLTNGTTADANQVMSNFNTLLNCSNNNLAHNGANSDITQLNGLTTPLMVPQGGTGLGTLTTGYLLEGNGGGTINLVAPSTLQSSGFINKLRDPTFVSWPNGTTGTIATAPSGSSYIAANGWAVGATGAAGVWAQVAGSGHYSAPFVGLYYVLKLTGAASNTDLWAAQRIGGSDGAALAGQTATVQFVVYNSTGTSLTPQVSTCYASAFNNFGTCTADLAATNLQPCANATWCIEAYTFSVSANASFGYQVKFDFGAQAANTQYVLIGAPDLRATPGVAGGLNAAPPAPELPGTAIELARDCQYYWTDYDNGTAPGTNTGAYFSLPGSFTGPSGGTQVNAISFGCRMRIAPTVTYYDFAGNASKVSQINNSATETDNLTPTAGPTHITTTGFYWQGNNATANTTSFMHVAAYADFW